MSGKRPPGVHDLKRRLMRRMSAMSWRDAERIAVTIREHSAACSFASGRSVDSLLNDIDQGAAWDRPRMEQAIRNRMVKR